MTGQLLFPFAHPLGRVARGKPLPRALMVPRLSNAAVRVPDPRHTHLRLVLPPSHPQIFVHEGARQALERKLSQAYQRLVMLSVTDNRRSMIAFSQKSGVIQARIHHMFLDAPGEVQDALVRYVVHNDRLGSAVVSQYIHENGYRIRAIRPVSKPLTTQGKTHDLLALYRTTNEKYFDGAVDALITWGRRASRPRTTPRRSIKLGSYSAVERLIRVHPVLDKPWVPRYFVSYIVYHEMLHHVIPASQGSGRRMLHPPLFQERERLFRDFERALTWERTHIGRLLRIA